MAYAAGHAVVALRADLSRSLLGLPALSLATGGIHYSPLWLHKNSPKANICRQKSIDDTSIDKKISIDRQKQNYTRVTFRISIF